MFVIAEGVARYWITHVGGSRTTYTQKVFGYVRTCLKGLLFIAELITMNGFYHLFEVKVEFRMFVFYSFGCLW